VKFTAGTGRGGLDPHSHIMPLNSASRERNTKHEDGVAHPSRGLESNAGPPVEPSSYSQLCAVASVRRKGRREMGRAEMMS